MREATGSRHLDSKKRKRRGLSDEVEKHHRFCRIDYMRDWVDANSISLFVGERGAVASDEMCRRFQARI